MASLALTYHASRLDSEAVRLAHKALAIDPDLVSVRILLAERALENNDGPTALDHANRAAAVEPSNASAHMCRGDALVLAGKDGEAKVAYQKAIALMVASGMKNSHSERLEVVRKALADGKLPAPRVPAQRTAHEKAVPPRSTPAPRPAQPRKPPPRTACSPGDPLCSTF